MRILFPTLVLGVLCSAQEPPAAGDQSQVSERRTIYIAASNTEKIRENGPFQVFNRDTEIDDENGRIAFKFFIKLNGQCERKIAQGIKQADGVYVTNYAGTNEFKILQASENTVIASDINVDEEGMETTLTGVFATGKDIEDEDFKKFKEVTKEKGIPEENIVKIITLGIFYKILYLKEEPRKCWEMVVLGGSSIPASLTFPQTIVLTGEGKRTPPAPNQHVMEN
ncbi:odorant-binding protein-like [Vicugna pacos]|uniref:Odorant-binding protein-like n=1 Tax=Vicugna pacos TaxID=30538 RepID=A0ABM5CVX0_VICPA